MNVGDTVKVEKCEKCSAVVGKTAKVKELVESEQEGIYNLKLNFGRGRPQSGRPEVFSMEEVSVVDNVVENETVTVDNVE